MTLAPETFPDDAAASLAQRYPLTATMRDHAGRIHHLRGVTRGMVGNFVRMGWQEVDEAPEPRLF